MGKYANMTQVSNVAHSPIVLHTCSLREDLKKKENGQFLYALPRPKDPRGQES
jgi:hypothetical protein